MDKCHLKRTVICQLKDLKGSMVVRDLQLPSWFHKDLKVVILWYTCKVKLLCIQDPQVQVSFDGFFFQIMMKLII